MNPSFVVPAQYFYALGSHLPPDVSADTRYRMACLQGERAVREIMASSIERGTIDALPAPELVAGSGITPAQASRRLVSLGRTKGRPPCQVAGASDLEALIEAWLAFANPAPSDDPQLDIAPFWTGPTGAPAHPAGHLRLVLCGATEMANVEPLVAAIGTVVGPIGTVADLVAVTAAQWHQIFAANPALLPAFTRPGTVEERTDAFIRHLERFFDITVQANTYVPAAAEPVAGFGIPSGDPLSLFLQRYAMQAGAAFAFGAPPVAAAVEAAAADVFPDDLRGRQWLIAAVGSLNDLFTLTDIGVSNELRISLMEALYSRGFRRTEAVAALVAEDFRDALTGTVAYEHSDAIHAKAGGGAGTGGSGAGPSKPINPDGSLVNCVPPAHLSPLGPVAYLQEMLRVSASSTCDQVETQDPSTLALALEKRRGAPRDLHATRANLETPLPLVDLVNECLEAMAADVPGSVSGVVHDTAGTELGGHALAGATTANGHDPAVLFGALPEHSSPATPVKKPAAYDALADAFSASVLPYDQPLDVNRANLRALGTTRYATMRRFRKEITEFVLDPMNEPASFRSHLWRYPVRFEIAREYLGIDPAEDAIFMKDLGDALLAELFGLSAADPQWLSTAVKLPVFLEQTGLEYCELFALWQTKFVEFSLREARSATGSADTVVTGRRAQGAAAATRDRTNRRVQERDRDDASVPRPVEFPQCPPCCLDDYIIVFQTPLATKEGLKRLAVFARLWRKLQALPGAGYSVVELSDICTVLALFDAAGNVNPDFMRQLAAFQILRDHFALMLADRFTAPGGTGADRTHLLALWVGPAAAKWGWAVDHLLDQIRHYAEARHHCQARTPEFLKLLTANLDPLSRLAGFDPAVSAETWHAHPTHTLRFVEVLAKIYASDFAIGEILFLFTTADHLGGDDPFALQPPNEAVDDPLQYPDDDQRHSLWHLRAKLLALSATDQDAAAWTWERIVASLREEFGFPSGAPDPLRALGAHFFPGILAAAGQPANVQEQQYRAPLNTTSPLMWNTPADGPFRYDQDANRLYSVIPLADAAVIQKISRIKPLGTAEQEAVRDLYFMPRKELARFAAIFPNFQEADEHLIQEADEGRRWAYFQRAFATFHARCRAIAEHLAAHVAAQTGRESTEGHGLAWRLLRHLFADENLALSTWEANSGKPPDVTWTPPPSGGAFAALLGLVGTGLLGEVRAEGSDDIVSRELRGPLDAFGSVRNDWNAPLPPLVPSAGLTLSAAQLRHIGIRNGFALKNADGLALGGAQGFSVTWSGVLLVEAAGNHAFHAGLPTPEGEQPGWDCAEHQRWRITLTRGQRKYVVLSHRWPGETAPARRSEPMPLRRGAYDITVEFVECAPEFDDPEDITRQRTGFQLKYAGPDTADRLIAVPADRLFVRAKDGTLALGLSSQAQGEALDYLRLRFVSTVRDVRRTYQRAFKALLFAHRFGLSAKPVSDDLQSEVGYMLAHAEDFAGMSFYTQGVSHQPHRAWFDFNLLPVGDNYFSPPAAQDKRVQPAIRRQRALFDSWERIFDYAELRTRADTAPEQPAWLLFHEAAERHPDDPAQTLRHIGIDLSHAALVLRYYKQFEVGSDLLEDEQWAIRAWRADTWLERLRASFTCLDVRSARPDLWASALPATVEAPETASGNEILTRFVRDGYIETEHPRRYDELKRLNDGLRQRAHAALIAFLCSMDRVVLPWGGHAREPRDLSELLLLDVEAGLCQRASRIQEAVTALQTFVQYARLRLDASWLPGPELPLLWDRKFASFAVWETCKRRDIYGENWIEWEELAQARASESFRFLEDRLRSATLTVPAPAGLALWTGKRPPAHPGLQLLQAVEPSSIAAVKPPREGLGLLGTEERHARPSWLAAGLQRSDRAGNGGDRPTDVPGIAATVRSAVRPSFPPTAYGELPWWIEAAIRLGVRFVRVAASGLPMGAATFQSGGAPDAEQCVSCCTECGVAHPPLVDEYYFWLMDSRFFEKQVQDANVKAPTLSTDEASWHDEAAQPKLLHWPSQPMVHLAWTRVHNGELKQTRRSQHGVPLSPGAAPDLVFVGRFADSLRFEVTGGMAPVGHEAAPNPGFRYDLASDSAEALPPVVADPPVPGPFLANFAAYPYFLYFTPGAPLVPPTFFSQAIVTAGWLRSHCRFEAALKWYEEAFDPLHGDAAWCRGEHGKDEPPAGTPGHSDSTGDGTVVARRRQAAVRSDDADTVHVTVPPRTAPDGCCKGGKVSCAVARQRAITLAYLETMLDWGDALMRRNSPEAFHQARPVFDAMARILGEAPSTILDHEEDGLPQTVADLKPLAPPLNPRLLSLYERVEDRRSLIHNCLNDRRLRNGRPGVDMPYFGNPPFRDGWKVAQDICADDGDWCTSASPYRFLFLVQKSLELASEVRSFGANLLAAFEKGDAEYLASLRAAHERQLLTLGLSVRQNQWRDADWQVQALRKTKEIAQTRRAYYQVLIDNGLNGGEIDYRDLTNASTGVKAAGNVSEAIAQLMHLIPDVFVGTVNFAQLPVGSKLASVFSAVARVSNTVGDILATTGSVRLTEGGWDRREEEWRHQVEVLDIEIEQVERQILGAERRRDMALRELNIQQRQIEQAAEMQDFLRDKFTNHELYLWLQRETTALHYQMYELALLSARQTQRAFNYERGHTARSFLPAAAWDDLHEGLLSGERLALALRQMEKAYLDENVREYELTKHLSLRQLFPLQFLQLKITGCCEVEIPEWLFDLDYPGHFMRRIRNVTMTVPATLGPYAGLHCRLTLLSSVTRVDPRLRGPAEICCEAPLLPPPLEPCACGDEDVPAKAKWSPAATGYGAVADDPRLVRQYAAREAIATSSGQADSGLFELSFRDERYLPFEFAGAVSRWRIELPHENNYFDMDTLSDVVLHLNYTAREGGRVLADAATASVQSGLPDAGRRAFDVRSEFPDAWRQLGHELRCDGDGARLEVCLDRSLFAFVPGNRAVEVRRVELLLEIDPLHHAEPSPAHHLVALTMPPPRGCKHGHEPCIERTFECVASTAWRGLYHGGIDIDLGPLRGDANGPLTFFLPKAIGRLRRLFVMCEYELAEHEHPPLAAHWQGHGSAPIAKVW